MMQKPERVLTLHALVPVPDVMVDAQIKGMKERYATTGNSTEEFFSPDGTTPLSPDELRKNFVVMIIESLEGLVFSAGEAIYRERQRKPVSPFMFTSGKCFVPLIADSLLNRGTLWPVEDPDAFLGHSYEWLMSVLRRTPGSFRREGWEFVFNEDEELLIRLTGEIRKEETSYLPIGKKATAKRLRSKQ